jgi:hypothetical protein
VSIAMVAPEVITEQHDAEAIHIEFSGRFGFGIDQWAYLPFEVPLGVQRIRVATSHDSFAVGGPIRNVLDLGMFGPAGHDLGNAAGFRGWSGADCRRAWVPACATTCLGVSAFVRVVHGPRNASRVDPKDHAEGALDLVHRVRCYGAQSF